MDELFEMFPDSSFNIDPKADDSVEVLADAIEAHGAIDRVCVGAFSDDRVNRMRERLGPSLCTSPGPKKTVALLTAAVGPAPLARRLEDHGHGSVQIPPGKGPLKLTANMVTGLHDLGLEVHVWTINDEPTMTSLLDMGVDGVMTDDVELLKSVMNERDQWRDQ